LEAIIKLGQTGWLSDQGLYFAMFLSKLDLLGIFENMGFISTVGNAPKITILIWNIRATETSSEDFGISNQMDKVSS